MIVCTAAAFRDLVGAGRSVGLVPTMGALHEGHLSLIRQAARDNDTVVVSIFVNPTQFTGPSDLAAYPRNLEGDASLAASAGATVIYAPTPEAIYPAGFASMVHVAGVTESWEGESRPGHFDGVATVVTILLNQIRPDRAYFGEKDFQQLAMVRRMHADLALPGEILEMPTVREADGLAMSSRNTRLSAAGRAAAPALFASLSAMQVAANDGEHSALKLTIVGAVLLRRDERIELDYLQIVDPATLKPVNVVTPGARAIVAATIDGVRLIDNLPLLFQDETS